MGREVYFFPASLILFISLMESEGELSKSYVSCFLNSQHLELVNPDCVISMLDLKIAIMFRIRRMFMRFKNLYLISSMVI